MNKLFLKASIVGLSICSSVAHGSLITSDIDTALNGAVIETFNSVTEGYYSSLSLPGVTIVGSGSDMRVYTDSNSSNYGRSGAALQNYGGSPSSFDLIFDTEVSAFGIWGGAYNNAWTFSAYDSLDNLIESVSVSTTCCTSQFYGLENSGMSKVTLSGFGDWVVFDDLTFVNFKSKEMINLL